MRQIAPKNNTQKFARLIEPCRHLVIKGNTILLYGAVMMMTALIMLFTSGAKHGISLGIIGIVVSYIGMSVAILGDKNGSSTSKLIRIISIPILLFLLVQLDLRM